ncbi:hypothetical protein [uncultured Methanobacterium sp.]|uniref:hypothetical protein n=1 Tax=uncultured Methanobacterium sp. TaxID=176306 RepID=UPI002AA77088|nr:hypothetical protein [uncultured Methanobacterium sp.]
MNKIDKVILGANPFEGVSYLSQEQRTHYREKFSKIDNIAEIIEVAGDFGVNTISTGNNPNVLKAIKVVEKEKDDVKVIPVIPSVYEYVKQSSLGGMSSLLDGITKYNKLKIALKAPSLIKKGLSKDVLGLFSDLIDLELEGFRDFDMPVIILHGVTVDMAISLNQVELLGVFCDFIREKYDAEPGIATHNFGKLMPVIEENNLDINIILAPVNKRGFMMNPSQEKCLDLVAKTDKTVIAKKILAGGVIDPKSAFEYIFDDLKINNAMVGIAGLDEAYQTLRVAKKYL